MGIKQTVAEGMLASGNVQEALESCSRKLSELAEDGVKYPDSNRIMAVINGMEKIREERKRELQRIILFFGGFSVFCFAAAAVIDLFIA